MGKKHIRKKIRQMVCRHKITSSGGGVLLLFIIGKVSGFFDNNRFDYVIEWITKLKSFLEYYDSVAIVGGILLVCVFFYLCKRMEHKRKIRKDFLKSISALVQQDNSISSININGEDGQMSLIIRRSNIKERKNNDSKVINFPVDRTISS